MDCQLSSEAKQIPDPENIKVNSFSSELCSYAIVIRHGERADNSEIQSERDKILLDFDPPLTSHGIE